MCMGSARILICFLDSGVPSTRKVCSTGCATSVQSLHPNLLTLPPSTEHQFPYLMPTPPHPHFKPLPCFTTPVGDGLYPASLMQQYHCSEIKTKMIHSVHDSHANTMRVQMQCSEGFSSNELASPLQRLCNNKFVQPYISRYSYSPQFWGKPPKKMDLAASKTPHPLSFPTQPSL